MNGLARFTPILAAAALMVAPAIAGGPDCEKRHAADKAGHSEKHCSMSAEECRRAFTEMKHRGWIGLMLDQNDDGRMVVKEVVPQSPAESAGFREGDVLVALNGVKFDEGNQDKLMSIRKDLHPGTSVTYTVIRDGRDRDLNARLTEMPDDVYEQMVTEHMKEYHDIALVR